MVLFCLAIHRASGAAAARNSEGHRKPQLDLFCIQPSFCSCGPGQSRRREAFVSFWVCDKYEREVRKRDKGGILALQKPTV